MIFQASKNGRKPAFFQFLRSKTFFFEIDLAARMKRLKHVFGRGGGTSRENEEEAEESESSVGEASSASAAAVAPPKKPKRRARATKGALSLGDGSAGFHQWTLLDEGPAYARVGAATVVLGDLIYLIGGADENGKFFQQMAVWDVRRATALPPLDDKQFPGRNFTSAVVANTHIYVFGGKANGYRNDLWRLKLSLGSGDDNADDRGDSSSGSGSDSGSDDEDDGPGTDKRRIVLAATDDASSPDEVGSWEEVKPDGPKPPPRFGHTSVAYGGRIFVHGGYDDQGTATGDMWAYVIGKAKWKKIQLEGARPAPRYHHAAVTYLGSMFMFGGKGSGKDELYQDLWQFDFERCEWTELQCSHVPSARFGHSLFVSQNTLCLYGGQTLKKKHADQGDVIFAEIPTKADDAWRFSAARHPSREVSAFPAGRYHHACCAIRGFVFVSGGFPTEADSSASPVLDDFWQQDLPVCYFEWLPPVILENILSYLTAQETARFAGTCRRNYRAATADSLWRRHLSVVCHVDYDESEQAQLSGTGYHAFLNIMSRGGIPTDEDGQPLVWRNMDVWSQKQLASRRRAYLQQYDPSRYEGY
jgi:Galactose oxidase, central domain/F-box-like